MSVLRVPSCYLFSVVIVVVVAAAAAATVVVADVVTVCFFVCFTPKVISTF